MSDDWAASNWPGADLAGLPQTLKLPRFDVQLSPPDLSPWRAGNGGIPGIMRFQSDAPGPHLAITALMHGNEIGGAIVLDELLRSGFRPRRGTLTIGFLNLAAFDRFDPAQPTLSRFVEEDMNRVWDPTILQSGRNSVELDRARKLRPLFDEVDILVDLHSMLWPSEPLILSGPTDKGRRFALKLGTPAMVVTDSGHSSGPRLIDYLPFSEADDPRVAFLIEAGPHWQADTVETMRIAVRSLLRQTGFTDQAPSADPPPRPRCAAVTQVITASTAGFSFIRRFCGGEFFRERGTLIARDGTLEIRTPHDDCLLVMPSLRPSRGHTAVRLARLLPDGD